MNIQQLRYFVVAATILNFNQASRLLYVSQPTLSRQIAKLEDELGLVLFYRSNKNVTLTAEGKKLLSESKEIISRFDNIISWAQNNMEKQVRASYTGIIDQDIMSKSLQTFEKKYPHTGIRIHEVTLNEYVEQLLNRKTDIILTHRFYVENFSNVAFKKVTDCRFKVAVNKSHPLNKLQKVRFKDLENESIIILSKDDFYAGYIAVHDIFKMNNFTPKMKYECHDIRTPYMYVEANKGVFIVCTRDDFKELYNTNLIDLDCQHDKNPDLVAAWLSNNEKPYISEFVNIIIENVNNNS